VPTALNARRKVTGDPRAQLGSVDLAEIRARYVGSRLPAQTAADMEALWLEVDRLRFENAGLEERVRRAREERDDIQTRYWQLQMAKVPGGPV
jgi:hypothetical protein